MTRTFYQINENGKNIIVEDIPTQSEERKVKIARAKEAVKYNKFVNALPDDIIKSIKGFVPVGLIRRQVRADKMVGFFGKVSDKWLMTNLDKCASAMNSQLSVDYKKLDRELQKIDKEFSEGQSYKEIDVPALTKALKPLGYKQEMIRRRFVGINKGSKNIVITTGCGLDKKFQSKKNYPLVSAPNALREMCAGTYESGWMTDRLEDNYGVIVYKDWLRVKWGE